MKINRNQTDEQIVNLVRSGDKNLFAEVIRRYEKKLFRYANYLVNDEQIALDVVQESFIKAYVNLQSFNVKLKFSSWMYRIVHNQAMNLIKKESKHSSLEEGFSIGELNGLEDDLIKKELHDHLYLCMEQMPIIYRSPLTLFFLEEKNYEEISDILRIPIGTVGTRINRAKHLVKKLCQKKK